MRIMEQQEPITLDDRIKQDLNDLLSKQQIDAAIEL